jgi:hypothetical protein
MIVLAGAALLIVHSTASADDVRPRGWRLSSTPMDGAFDPDDYLFTWNECVAARDAAITEKIKTLTSSGNEVIEHDGLVAERQPDGTMRTVAVFRCRQEPAWTVVIKHVSLAGKRSEDHVGPFLSIDECVEFLESELDFKVKALQRFGDQVSIERGEPLARTVKAAEARGSDARRLTTTTVYECHAE